ncbi:MAG: AMIN domain-containing protein [Gemmatimonadaceae bacterium]|nr:AMIN domain-containing protein [Gemmatimonadaceae bacterium]
MRRTRIHAALASATLLLGVTGAARPPHPAAPGAVTALSVVPATGRADVIIAVQGDVDVMDFALDNGRRVVVDIKGATLGIPAKMYDKVSRAGIANVRFAQFSAEVVRVVLELDEARAYTVVHGEQDVRVSVSGPSEFAAWQAQGQGKPVVTAVSVQGAAQGAPKPPQPAATTASTDLPTLSGASNPRIGTPNAAANPQGQARSQQPRISVAFHDAEIREVAVYFANFSGKTIVLGPSVTGTVRATIVDQPWDVAFKTILDPLNLAAVEDSTTGIISVDSYKNLADRAAVEPLYTHVVQVNYTKADQMANTVRSLLGAGCGGAPGGGAAAGGAAPAAPGAAAPSGATTCSARGSVSSDEKTNSVIITETLARLADIESYIRDLDVRTPQITIKAKIISVDRTGTEQLGLAYDLGTASTFSNSLNPRPGIPGEQRVNLAGDGFAGVGNSQRLYKGNSSLTIIHNKVLGGFNLTSFLDALSSVQLTDVQAEPSATTVDNKEATLFSGANIAFLLTPPVVPGQIQAVAPQIQRQDVGIQLKVTPHVTANRQVLLDVYAEQQQLTTITVAGPSTNKHTAQTQVLVSDGESAVIGGLTQTELVRNRSGIPMLMDLPGIGRLFSQSEVTERKKDLLIIITPHIVDEGEVARPRKP